jgi:hypothetical protein
MMHENERMLELEVEATAYADSKVPANNRYNDIYYAIVRRKFAELIVRECALIVLNGKYDYEKFNADDEFHRGFNQALDSATEGIKQHFGVEE